MRRVLRDGPSLSLWCVMPLLQRYSSTESPSADEVRRSFGTLGLPATTSYADTRKKYLELAKAHHPDVAGGSKGTSSHSNMSAINEAYDVLSRAHKAGLLHQHSSHSSSSGGASGPSAFHDSGYGSYEDVYHPAWEEMPPEYYEAMWEQMRAANSERNGPFDSEFHAAFRPDRGGHGRRGRGRSQQRERQHTQPPQEEPPKKRSTTWSDEDLTALKNMYQDGKSFEFIANALGKKQPDVVAEFNRWYSDQQSEGSRRQPRHHHHSKRRQHFGTPQDMYAAMGDDFDVEDAFYAQDAFDENGVPLEVHMYYDIADEGPQPYGGQHFMHRGGRGGRGGHRGGHRGGFRGKPRYQR